MHVYLAIGSCVLSLMHLEIHALFMIGKSALAVVPIFDDNDNDINSSPYRSAPVIYACPWSMMFMQVSPQLVMSTCTVELTCALLNLLNL